MDGPTLPERLLASLGLDAGTLRAAEPADLRRMAGRDPGLLDWYGLLTAHARAAAAHLMLSKKFLFKPQHRRDVAGLGDRPLVSNRAGTTGMNETFLETPDPGAPRARPGPAAVGTGDRRKTPPTRPAAR